MPVICNLHTIIKEPDPGQAFIIQEISRLSDRLLAMSHKARELLMDIYNVPGDKITFKPLKMDICPSSEMQDGIHEGAKRPILINNPLRP
jgi:hypothetical protein